jgi:hypothetical protein
MGENGMSMSGINHHRRLELFSKTYLPILKRQYDVIDRPNGIYLIHAKSWGIVDFDYMIIKFISEFIMKLISLGYVG